MYSFKNDYSETVHPSILDAVVRSGNAQNTGYGLDKCCERAEQILREKMNNSEVDIHFLAGGTMTNLTLISHVLKSYEAVISADSGHINVHETGAIEATGHKVIAIPSVDGKLTPEMVRRAVETHTDEHMVLPAMVYLSHPTEVGTIYSKRELAALAVCCKEYELPLYLDGARLAMALTAECNDVSLEELATYVDAFYIGGTKVGAMFGEALVICKEEWKRNFRFSMKQRGAMLAKGWLLGLQFEQLFVDNLYWELGQNANQRAAEIKRGFEEHGFTFAYEPCTNQLFPILPDDLICKIEQDYEISFWEKREPGYSCVRFCTSWATAKEAVEQFAADFARYLSE